MLESIIVWEREKLVNTWKGTNFSITQETEIIRKTTVFFDKKSEFLDKSINESENNISKYVLQIIRVFFSLISKIFILSLKVIEALLYVILIIAKALFYVILIIATSLLYVISFVIKTIGIWLIIMVIDFLKFMWKSINSLVVTFSEFMRKLINSSVGEIKNATVKHAVEKPLQNQSKLYQLIVFVVFSLLFAWIFEYIW